MTPTRDRILDAARVAFATRGVDGTAITDLEDAAGLAAGSGGFYRYFRTKDEVLVAVVRREIDRVRAAQDATPPPTPTGDAAAQITTMFGDGLATLRSLGPLIAIVSREQGRIPELATEVSAGLIDGGMRHDLAQLTALLGDRSPEDTTALGAVVLSALVGYMLATDFFGAPPADVDQERFLATLATLVASLPSQGPGARPT